MQFTQQSILRGLLCLRKLLSRLCVSFLRCSSYLSAKRRRRHPRSYARPFDCLSCLLLIPSSAPPNVESPTLSTDHPIICPLLVLSTDRPIVCPLLVLSSGRPVACAETAQLEETLVVTAHNIPSFQGFSSDRANPICQ